MKKAGFPIPIKDIATKRYVDGKISSSLGIFMEHFDDKFQILIEGQEMIIERLERFEIETGQNFKNVDRRLTALELK